MVTLMKMDKRFIFPCLMLGLLSCGGSDDQDFVASKKLNMEEDEAVLQQAKDLPPERPANFAIQDYKFTWPDKEEVAKKLTAPVLELPWVAIPDVVKSWSVGKTSGEEAIDLWERSVTYAYGKITTGSPPVLGYLLDRSIEDEVAEVVKLPVKKMNRWPRREAQKGDDPNDISVNLETRGRSVGAPWNDCYLDEVEDLLSGKKEEFVFKKRWIKRLGSDEWIISGAPPFFWKLYRLQGTVTNEWRVEGQALVLDPIKGETEESCINNSEIVDDGPFEWWEKSKIWELRFAVSGNCLGVYNNHPDGDAKFTEMYPGIDQNLRSRHVFGVIASTTVRALGFVDALTVFINHIQRVEEAYGIN